MQVSLNARFKMRPMTGVERFATEVTNRLWGWAGIVMNDVRPSRQLSGLRGHAWEQFVLPGRVQRDAILFSPCNTGPLAVKRQFAVIHDAAVWDCPDAFSGKFRRLYQSLLPALAKRVEAVGTVSEFSRQRLARFLGISEDKIYVLGNATSSRFSPALPGEVSARSDGSPSLLCVGSLDPRKNFSTLIEAWQVLSREERLPPGAQLNIIGAANPSNFSQFDVVNAPGVNWLGRVSDDELIQHYRSANAFVFPSLYEGFGLPPLEAMACGCPVLLSSEASLPEVGGEVFDPADPESKGAVIYFDPRSVSEMAGAVESILTLDAGTRSILSENAVQHAKTFTWGNVAQRTRKAMESIA